MNYNELYGRLMNVSANSPLSEKREALRFVVETLVDNDEPDFLLKLRANSTRSALNAPEFDEVELAIFVDNEIRDIKNELQKKLADQQDQANEDVAMAGGRKKRRGKKTKKTKKSRRYTRRR